MLTAQIFSTSCDGTETIVRLNKDVLNAISDFWKRRNFEGWFFNREEMYFINLASDDVYNSEIMKYLKELKHKVANKFLYVCKLVPDMFVEALKGSNKLLVKFMIVEGFMESRKQITQLCEEYNFDSKLEFSPILRWIEVWSWWGFESGDTKNHYIKTNVKCIL